MAGTVKARRRPSGRFSAPRLAAATEQILKRSSKERSPDINASGLRGKNHQLGSAGHNTDTAKVIFFVSL